jgi:hypothetical protein
MCFRRKLNLLLGHIRLWRRDAFCAHQAVGETATWDALSLPTVPLDFCQTTLASGLHPAYGGGGKSGSLSQSVLSRLVDNLYRFVR